MPQIINETNWGARIGGSLGEGIGEGLSYLLNDKLGQMQSARKQAQYSELLQKNGVPAAKANVLAYHATSDPGSFHKILGQFGGVPDTQSQQSQQAYQGQQAQRALQQFQHPEAVQLSPGAPARQQQSQPTPAQAQQANLLSNLFQGLGQQQQNQQQPASRLGEGVDILNRSAKNQLLKAAAPELEAEKAASRVSKELAPSAREKESQKIASRHHRPAYNYINAPLTGMVKPETAQQLTPKEQEEKRRAAEKEKQKTEQAEKKATAEQKKKAKEQTRKSLDALPPLTPKEQSDVNKAEKKYYDATLAKKEAGDKAEATMDKLEELIDKGNLPYAWSYNLLDRLESSGKYIGKGGTGSIIAPLTGAISGVIVPTVGLLKDLQKGITSTDTEEYIKTSLSFIDGMKAIFGGKVSNDEMKAYLNLIPTLSQTDAGKKAIIKNMRSAVKADKIKYDAMKDIIRENGGKFPQTLGLLVNERVDAELGKLADAAFDIPGLQAEEKIESATA